MTDTTANDVHGPLQSGSFGGPVQTVVVQAAPQSLPSPDDPAEPNIKEQVKTIRHAVLVLNQMFVSERAAERKEREERWKETDNLWRKLARQVHLVLWLSAFAASGVLLLAARLMGWW